jgi:hypothetical protein
MSGRLTGSSTGTAQVRDVLADEVATAGQGLNLNVFRARLYPLKTPALPAALVYGYDETYTLQSLNPSDYAGQNIAQMVVQLNVSDRDPLVAEQQLEILIGAIRTGVLESHALLAEGGAIERILSVHTTRELKAEAADVQGQAQLVFVMQWSEVYWLREDEIDQIDMTLLQNGETVAQVNVDVSPPAP